MKVSTDSFLLGAWVALATDHKGIQRVLDIGTGCGILALMLTQRLMSLPQNDGRAPHIDAVELDVASAAQAQENVSQSPWTQQIHVHAQDILDWAANPASGNYDLVISNPPYFSLPSGAAEVNPQIDGAAQLPRRDARHQHRLDFQQLFTVGAQQLAAHGAMAVVLPFSEWERAKAAATATGLWLTRCCWVQSKVSAPVKLVLATFRLAAAIANPTAEVTAERLVIHAPTAHKKGTGLEYSGAFKALLQDFYLGTRW